MPSPESTGKFSSLLQFFKFPDSRATALAIALHLVIVLPLAGWLNIWLDEGWTMETTANGFFYAWREAVTKEHQAPLYFAFLAVWRNLNNSLFFARLFSIVCITVTIALIPALVRRLMPQNSENLRVLLPFIVALHPYSIWASLEARVYALVVLLSAMLILFWFDAYVENKNHRRAQAFYVLLAVISLYTNYYLGFLLFANACALLALKRWKTFVMHIGQAAIAGLFFSPLVFIIRQQFATNADYYHEQTTVIEGVKTIWNTFNYFLLPSPEWQTTAFLRVWSGRLAAIALLYLAIKFFRQIHSATKALSVIVMVISLFLMTAFFLMGSEYTQLRHSAPLFIPLLLFFAALLINLTPNRGLYVWLILLIILVPTRLFSDYSNLVKNGDWNRVANFIETNEAENQPITTFQLHDSIPLDYAYHGKNQILRARLLDDWAAEDKELTATRWRRQIELLIEQIPADPKYLWLVTESYCHNENTGVECRPLEDFIEANYTVEKSEDFYLRRVRLLRRK
jgi:hypothetical protein